MLFDRHNAEQVDAVAERIISLGGVSIAMTQGAAEMTRIPRLLNAHQIILELTRTAAREATDKGDDDGTDDLLAVSAATGARPASPVIAAVKVTSNAPSHC